METTKIIACEEELEMGLNHLSEMASEIHDRAIETRDHQLGIMAERLAFWSSILSKYKVEIQAEREVV